MTRRRRHSKTNSSLRGIDKPQPLHGIDTPALPLRFAPGTVVAGGARESHENPASYPSPEERLRIIARRDELTKALINLRVQGKLGESQVNELIAEYGANEVLHVSLVLQNRFQSSEFLVDEPRIYRHYRLGFARFGGTRRFLSQREQEELSFERAMLYAQREFKSLIKRKPSPRELELGELVMMDWHFWDDITPLDIPPRPTNYPAPASYPPPASALLAWGWDLDPNRITREHAAWKSYLPDLERIVFDETLRNGWPSEPASWAPWHALHLLGALRAIGCARKLADLHKLPNDWLSDLLPQVWAQMGASVEPALWDILDDPTCKPEARGLAVSGLEKLIKNKSIPRPPAIRALAERLSPGRTDNAIVNAYIVFVLENLNAVETKDAVRAAFKKKLVDTKIMDARSVSFLND